MKKLLLIFSFSFLIAAFGTPVMFPVRSFFGGGQYLQTITVTAVNTSLTDYTNLYAGQTISFVPSGGTNPIIQLQPNDYVLTLPELSLSYQFSLPATNAVVNVLTLITNGLLSYYPANLYTNYPTFAEGDLRWDPLGAGSSAPNTNALSAADAARLANALTNLNGLGPGTNSYVWPNASHSAYASQATNAATATTATTATNLVNFPFNKTLWVDPVNGSDVTGQRGNAAKPFQSIGWWQSFTDDSDTPFAYYPTGALSAAVGGDLIRVAPGTNWIVAVQLWRAGRTHNGVSLIGEGEGVTFLVETNCHDGTVPIQVVTLGPLIQPGNNSLVGGFTYISADGGGSLGPDGYGINGFGYVTYAAIYPGFTNATMFNISGTAHNIAYDGLYFTSRTNCVLTYRNLHIYDFYDGYGVYPEIINANYYVEGFDSIFDGGDNGTQRPLMATIENVTLNTGNGWLGTNIFHHCVFKTYPNGLGTSSGVTHTGTTTNSLILLDNCIFEPHATNYAGILCQASAFYPNSFQIIGGNPSVTGTGVPFGYWFDPSQNKLITGGNVTATNFTGNGSGLTNLNITGSGGLTNAPSSFTNNSVIWAFNSLGQMTMTNTATGAYGTWGTNGHLKEVDQLGNVREWKTNSFRIDVTVGGVPNTLLWSNSVLTLNGCTVLTNLNAANAVGTLPLASLPAAAVTNGQDNVTFGMNFQASTISGANLYVTNITAVANGSFTGNGAGLTSLNPANLSAGVAPTNFFISPASVTNDGTQLPLGTVSRGQTNTSAGMAGFYVSDGVGRNTTRDFQIGTNYSTIQLVGTLDMNFATNHVLGLAQVNIKFGTTNLFMLLCYTNQ